MIVGIKDIRIGDTPIAKVMAGDSLVWSRKKYYHETTKTQAYYDLGEIITPEKAIEIDINFSKVGDNLLFGSRSSYGATNSYAVYENRFDVGSAGTPFRGTDVFPEGVFCTIRLFNKRLFIDGIEVLNQSTNNLAKQTLNTYIFEVNTNNRPTNAAYALNAGVKLYDVRIYDENGSIKHNYEPQADQSRRCSITGKVLPKLGSGRFDVVEIQRPYEDWVYEDGEPIVGIKGTGEQYIDLEYSYGELSKLVDVVALGDVMSGSIYSVSGVYGSLYWGSRSGQFVGGNPNVSSEVTADNDRHTWVIDTATKQVTVDGIELPIRTTTADYDNNIYLFGINNRGVNTYFQEAIRYGTELYNLEGKLIVLLIPYLKKDGTTCMLDLMSREYRYNVGTGSFVPITEELIISTVLGSGLTPAATPEENLELLSQAGIKI